MRQSIQRRSFLKYCLAGGAGLVANPYGWTGALGAPTASSGAPAKFRPAKTLCGLFNIPSLEIGKRMGAQCTRLIFGTSTLDADIAAARSGTFPPRFQLVKDLSGAGIPVMATFNWLNKKKGGGKLPEPDSDEWKKWLETGRGFVQVLSPYLVGVTLENEPFLNYPELSSEKGGGTSRAYDWFKALAAVVRETAPQLLISTPALVSPKSRKDKGVEHFFGWAGSDPNIDIADVHCHVADIKEIEEILSFTASKFTRGIIITEWSQAGRLKPWAGVKLNAGFAAKWKRDASLTNEKYVIQCEAHPVAGPGDSRVSLAEWNDFVATAPLDPNFMMDAFKVIQKHGVLMADYGAAIQYGSPHFDMKQLYANLSVVPGPNGQPQPNYKLPEWYKAMVASA